MATVIPISKPSLGDEEIRSVERVIQSGWITQGPEVLKFEKSFAEKVGAPFACAVSSCTAALQLALLAVGVKPGEVVITVSHSFIATANSIRACFAEPVFVDIQADTLNMDPKLLGHCLEKDCFSKEGQLYYRDTARLSFPGSALTRPEASGRVAAILIVHQLGFPADMKSILASAQKYGLPVVEDAACALGSQISIDGDSFEMIGKPHGDIACFSFHPRKIVSTGDGGMLTTRNPKYDSLFRLLRQHGMNVSDTQRHQSAKVVFENYVMAGFNFRMTDVQAAIGLVQLEKLGGMIEKRVHIAQKYSAYLQDEPLIELFQTPAHGRCNWQSYPVRISSAYGGTQESLMQRLLDKGISTRRGVMNAHRELPYQGGQWNLPQSESCQDRVILLPLYDNLSDDEVKFCAEGLKECLHSL